MFRQLLDYYVFIAAICTSRGWNSTADVYIARARAYHDLMENKP